MKMVKGTKLERMFSLYERLSKRHHKYNEECYAKAKQLLLDANVLSVNTGLMYNNRREVFAISPRTGYVYQTAHLETIDYTNDEMAEEIRNLLSAAHSEKSLFISTLLEDITWAVMMLTNTETFSDKRFFLLNINDETYYFDVSFFGGARTLVLNGKVPTVDVLGDDVFFN